MENKLAQHKELFLQFGEGGFLRGFVDWMIEKMNESTALDAGVVVVQPIGSGLCAALEAQGCTYHHIIRGEEGVEVSKIRCITRCVDPYTDYEEYLSLAGIPSLRYVISNTTEAGIVFDPTVKEIDTPPAAFPAKVAKLLEWRRRASLPGFVFLPCELIDRNGDKLKEAVLQYGELWGYGEAFARFVCEENVFCSTLVDRINTGFPRGEEIAAEYPDDAFLNTSEFFHLWVIETDYPLEKELPFAQAGLNVIVTKDALEKYRTRKVRILNGAHTAMIPYALLLGVETVGECMENETVSSFVKRCVYDEIIPTLDLPKEELLSYADSVFERFKNPFIKHYCASIALNSVSKFKVRVLPSILEYYKRFGKAPKNLMYAFSRLIAFYRTDMTNDDPEVTAFMKNASVAQILAKKEYFGEDLSFMLSEVPDENTSL